MKTDILGSIAQDLAEQYRADNGMYLSVGGECLLNTLTGEYTFGYDLLARLCMLCLLHDGKVLKSSPVSEYVKAAPQGITIDAILHNKSGICDTEITFEDAIKDAENTLEILRALPTDKQISSDNVDSFLLYVTAETASGKMFSELCREYVSEDVLYGKSDFCISGRSLCLLAEKLLDKSLCVDFSYMYAFDENSEGVGCKNDNGFAHFCLSGRDFCDICIDYDTKVLFVSAGKQRNPDFVRNVLDNAEILLVKPKNATLRPLSPENAGRVNGLCIEYSQLAYTCDVKSALLYAFSRNRSAYAICDSLRVVGVAVLNKNDGEIEYLAIDKRYQSKGYGKAAVSLCICELKNVGAKSASIAVHNNNKRAFRLYLSCGFSVLHYCAEYSLLILTL